MKKLSKDQLIEKFELFNDRAHFWTNRWGPTSDEAIAYKSLANDINMQLLDVLTDEQEQRINLALIN
jgi:hypothetical protein